VFTHTRKTRRRHRCSERFARLREHAAGHSIYSLQHFAREQVGKSLGEPGERSRIVVVVVVCFGREDQFSTHVFTAQETGEPVECVRLVVAVARGWLLHGGEGGVANAAQVPAGGGGW
jgi:hypothetical protein